MFGGVRGRIASKRIRKAEKNHFGRMLSQNSKEQLGLEIGPSLRPCAPKSEGYHVEIIDWVGRQQLIERYAAMGLDTSRIEEVDYIWDGRPYSELTDKTNYYDVGSSNVLE